MKQNISCHETVTFSDAIHRKCVNDCMQYLVECSEKIVMDNPKS